MQIDNQPGRVDGSDKGPKPIAISVNGQQVEMSKGDASGSEIKEAAIVQGVAIGPDFSLYLRGKDGLEPVRDDEIVKLKKGFEFSAVAPHDVS